MSKNLHRRISFGLFEFEVATGELRREGVAVKLAPQPARVLGLLLSRPGEVVSRDELRRELWGEETFVDFERGVNFCITQARTALGDASDNPRFIQTVPRRGYRFIAPVRPLADLEPMSVEHPEGITAVSTASTVATAPVTASVVGTRRSSNAVTTVSVVSVAVAAALVVAWWIQGSGSAIRSIDRSAQPVSDSIRIVVLPFANLTGDPQVNDIVVGLTDELITQLGANGRDRVAVVARTSSMAYRGTTKSVAEIARELNVRFVVEGSIRREGEALRITGALVDTQTQTSVLPLEDLMAAGGVPLAQQETHTSIRLARKVAAHLRGAAETTLASPGTTDATAWEAFMQASASIERGTPGDVRRAQQWLETAVARDASFAAAWARLAETHHVLVMMGIAAPNDAYPAAHAAATRALALDPRLAEAHLAAGLIALWYDWKPAVATTEFQRALVLNPSLAAAHHDYAWALVAVGRTGDAIQHILASRDLDPMSTRANNDVGWLHLFVRQPDDAARACQRTLAIDGRSLEAQACLERAYVQRDLFEAALQAARTTLPSSEDAPTVARGADGLREIWMWRLRQLERAAGTRWINPYTLAVQYALTGDADKAMDALDHAYAQRVGMLVFLSRDPAMDALRGTPRFDALVKKITAVTS